MNIDMREWCCYIVIGSTTVYLDWSMMDTDGLIVDVWDNNTEQGEVR